LARRLSLERPNERVRISSPEDIVVLISSEMAALDQEELRVILLNTKNEVLRVVTVYRGSVNAAQIRVAEVFKEAVRHNAPSLVIAHNHPSGDPTPSSDDVAVTRELVQAGRLLDIEVPRSPGHRRRSPRQPAPQRARLLVGWARSDMARGRALYSRCRSMSVTPRGAG
jgi:DNA repair protein RadC